MSVVDRTLAARLALCELALTKARALLAVAQEGHVNDTISHEQVQRARKLVDFAQVMRRVAGAALLAAYLRETRDPSPIVEQKCRAMARRVEVGTKQREDAALFESWLADEALVGDARSAVERQLAEARAFEVTEVRRWIRACLLTAGKEEPAWL